MNQVLIRNGQAVVEHVPAPVAGQNEILVQVHYSCISAGTEIAALKNTHTTLTQRGLRDPRKILKALDRVRKNGFAATVAQVKSIRQREETGKLAGYSASGVVLEVGPDIHDIKPGDRIACAGAGIANHAEFIAVPRNLVVKVPEGLSLQAASTVALGSIAMQGVRRADPKLGEAVAVIGLGILGQLTFQMLKASGCKVIGVDIDQRRVDLALSLGMDKGLNPTENNNVLGEVVRFCGGYGVDSVIISASTENSEVINDAMKMCRKKGKVVIVGAVGLNLERHEFYKKELDILISTSYGPGRYDEKYERTDIDYPYAYVRWTENRNMGEYLNLLANGKINIESLVERVYRIEEAGKAYEELRAAEAKPLIVLLEYNRESIPDRKTVVSEKRLAKDKLNVALIGSGSFATKIHLPNLKKLSDLYNIYAIVDKIGSNAKATAKQCHASYATTDYKQIWEDENVDMVIIATRHDLHAGIAIEAARTGKAIFVEKPMAINNEELRELTEVLGKTKVPFMVGFNRRFSPVVRRAKEVLKGRQGPMIINYQMNAGFIPREHWVHGPAGAGRNIGEACHIYDLFTYFTESEVDTVSASSITPRSEQYMRNDNFVATARFKDGSVCNLLYTALGHPSVPKERMEIYWDEKTLQIDDYKRLMVFGESVSFPVSAEPQKGHYEELKEFAASIREGDGYPIPLWQIIQATEISFHVEETL